MYVIMGELNFQRSSAYPTFISLYSVLDLKYTEWPDSSELPRYSEIWLLLQFLEYISRTANCFTVETVMKSK
jgi:hypothetical protein